MRLLLTGIVACALASGLAASPGAAKTPEQSLPTGQVTRGAPAWKSQTVVSPRHDVSQVTAVVAANRDVVGWNEGTIETRGSSVSIERDGRPGAYVAFRQQGAKRFGSPHRLTKVPVGSFNLAAAADGSILAAWVTANRKLQVAWWLPSSGWSDPKTLGSRAQLSFGFPVSLVLAPDGTGLISWLSGPLLNRAVQLAAVLGPGDVGPTQMVARGPEVTPHFVPAVDAADGGAGIVTWAGSCPTNGRPIYPAVATAVRDGAVLGSPAAIPASECVTSGLEADIDASGDALVLLNGKAPPDLAQVRVAFKSGSSDTFSPASKISGSGSSNGGSLGGSPSGSAVAIWSDSGGPGGRNQTAEAAWSSGSGIFGQPESLGRIGSPIEVAEETSGDAVAVWQEPIPSLRITVQALCTSQIIGAPLTISERLSQDRLALPDVALSGSKALVAWGNPTRKNGLRGITAVSVPVVCGPS